MADLTGRWRIDGIDLWGTYGIVIEEGSAEFLKYPPKKPSTEHDWGDSDGIDVDLSNIFLSKNQGVIRFALFATSTQDYMNKHDAFLALWKQPGTRRLEIAAHNDRSYFVYYQEISSFEQVKPLKPGNPLSAYKIIHSFSMVVVEPEPKLYPNNIYIITEDGKFLIT